MAESFIVSLPTGAVVASEGDGRMAVQTESARVTLKHLTAAMQSVLSTLAGTGASEDQLAEKIGQSDGIVGLSRFYNLLDQLDRRGSLWRSVNESSRRLATLVPCSRDFV